MITLALNMIAKNEATRIHHALQSAVRVCDELIVADTGSTDRTVDFAVEYGATVIRHVWREDYAAARNEAIDHTTADWILVLDADDVLTDEAVEKILELKETLGNGRYDGVMAMYDYEHDEAGRCTQRFPIQRLFRCSMSLAWTEPVHEYIPFPDPSRVLERLDITVTHRPEGKDRNDRSLQLRILERAIDLRRASVRTWYFYGNELVAAGRLDDAVRAYQRFLDLLVFTEPEKRYHALVSQAQCHLHRGRVTQAQSVALAALREDPARAEAYALLGEIEYQHGEYHAALPLYSAAVSGTPPVYGYVAHELYGWFSHERLALCHQKLGNRDLAHAHAMVARAEKTRHSDHTATTEG